MCICTFEALRYKAWSGFVDIGLSTTGKTVTIASSVSYVQTKAVATKRAGVQYWFDLLIISIFVCHRL